MKSLNWSQTELAQELHPESGREKTRWVLGLSGEQLLVLSDRLEELFSGENEELRLELPEGWILFWKSRRTGEGTKLLVAHPEMERWVGTLALEPSIAAKLIKGLKDLGEGETIDSRQWMTAAPSNLDMIIRRTS